MKGSQQMFVSGFSNGYLGQQQVEQAARIMMTIYLEIICCV